MAEKMVKNYLSPRYSGTYEGRIVETSNWLRVGKYDWLPYQTLITRRSVKVDGVREIKTEIKTSDYPISLNEIWEDASVLGIILITEFNRAQAKRRTRLYRYVSYGPYLEVHKKGEN